MLTAELRNLPHTSSVKFASSAPAPVPVLFASRWMNVGVWCLAALSLGASLAYTGSEERPAATAHDLGRGGVAASPFSLYLAPGEPPLAVPAPACAICGQVEAVAPLPHAERLAGRKRMYQVKVRMEDGRTQTVHVEKPLAVGTQVTLQLGVLRVGNA